MYNFLLKCYKLLFSRIQLYFNARHQKRFYLFARLLRAVLFPNHDPLFSSGNLGLTATNRNADHDDEIPSWLLQEMEAVGLQIDYQIYPDLPTLAKYRFSPIAIITEPGTELNYLLAQRKHITTSHIYILPWLKRGGADKIALHCINTIAADPSKSVSVLITHTEHSEWLSLLHSNVNLYQVSTSFCNLDLTYQTLVFVTLLEQLKPDYIHIINSKLALQALDAYGCVVQNIGKVIIHLFCENHGSGGQLQGYGSEFLPRIYSHVDRVVTDNHHIINQLKSIYGFPASLFTVLNTPLIELSNSVSSTRVTTKKTTTKLRSNVLWAGRLDRQKRPDLLASIAKRSPQLNFTFFGTSFLDPMPDTFKALIQMPNVTYGGQYDDPAELQFSDYDIYLYTSQWDGLPVALLEAAQRKIPIVASDVGGVSELIGSERGFLIAPFDNVDKYLEALEFISINYDEGERRAIALHSYVSIHHSTSQFTSSLYSLYDAL